MSKLHSTTVLCVSRSGITVMAGDGQVTEGSTVIKNTAKKIRTLYKGKVLAGFAGAAADAFTLFERFERQLERHSGDLLRASVELAKDWRTDKALRRLEALLLVANNQRQLIISGSGDVIEPENSVSAIGSGGLYARSAALALLRHTNMEAYDVVKASMNIASELCIYTNNEITIESIK